MATGLQEAIGVAPVIAHSAPATVSTARRAVSRVFILCNLRVSDRELHHPVELTSFARLRYLRQHFIASRAAINLSVAITFRTRSQRNDDLCCYLLISN